MDWHKESARSSEEVRGVRGIVQELQNLHESSSQQTSPTCCGWNILGRGAKVLSGSAQGICPPHRVRQWEQQIDQRDEEEEEEENGGVEEIRNNAHNKMTRARAT